MYLFYPNQIEVPALMKSALTPQEELAILSCISKQAPVTILCIMCHPSWLGINLLRLLLASWWAGGGLQPSS